MADYWKSQPRKFCEYCKCWIADNKPSREYHEKGKRHQENVKKKLDELMKKGVSDAKKEKQMSDDMVAMEKAAINALKKDIRTNPSLASQYGIQLKSTPPPKEHTCEPRPPDLEPEIDETAEPEVTKPDEKQVEKAEEPEPNPTATVSKKIKKKKKKMTGTPEWQLAYSPEGYPYYWNTKTSEVTWTMPEGFVTTESDTVECVEKDTPQLEEATSKPESTVPDEPPDKPPSPEQPQTVKDSGPDIPEEIPLIPLPVDMIPLPSSCVEEKNKGNPLPPCEEEPKPPSPEIRSVHISHGPAPNPLAYSQWETVAPPVVGEPVDYQLPMDPANENITIETIHIEAPKIKFREKKVDTLGSELIAFKKRKLAQRSMKKREES